MSEREPITGELREAVEWEPTFCGPDRAMVPQPEFDSLCDAIDAVHAGLERENAELRERLAALDESADSMHDGGSITDELRGWYKDRMFMGNGWQELDNIADRIDAEHEAQLNDAFETRNSDENLESDGWVRLPMDADDVPIHVGERVQLIGNDPSTVSHMSLAGDGWRVYVKYDGDLGTGSGEPSRIRHHHAPTVEDVLTEFGIDWEHESDCEDRAALLREYAAKLRLVGDGE